MKKRYVRRKRVIKRRRFMRRRMMKKQSYDGLLKTKIHVTIDVPYLSSKQHADVTVNWAGNGNTAQNPCCRLTTLNEFTTFNTLYREYKVVGCKMQLIPINNVTAAGSTGLYNGVVATDTTAVLDAAAAENQLYSYVDFKEFTLSRTYTKYVNVSKYMAKRGIKWLPVSDNYPDVTTLFRLYMIGFADLDICAKLHVTYYVAFKAPRL